MRNLAGRSTMSGKTCMRLVEIMSLPVINALYSMMRRVSHDRSDCLRYKQRFA